MIKLKPGDYTKSPTGQIYEVRKIDYEKKTIEYRRSDLIITHECPLHEFYGDKILNEIEKLLYA